jgi:glycolate oxidase subunit GlcD
MMTRTEAIDIQAGALLAVVPSEVDVQHLNQLLEPAGLCLPIDPLLPAQSLHALVACNAGGRRRLRYGPIVRYLRAATFAQPDAAEPLVVGGPTLKRATGYGLHRALAGADLGLGQLQSLTLGLRPLPATRVYLQISCPDMPAAVAMAGRVLHDGLLPSALAVAADGDSGVQLLCELEGLSEVLDRQTEQFVTTAADFGATVMPAASTAWQLWEGLAHSHTAPDAKTLDLTLPRAALPAFVSYVQQVRRRYRLDLPVWGDLGVGTLHLRAAGDDGSALEPDRAAEAVQALALIAHAARELGGATSTELRAETVRVSQLVQLPGSWQEDGASLRPPPAVVRGSSANERLNFREAQHPADVAPALTQMPDCADPSAIIDELRAVVGPAYVLVRPEDLACYELDASIAQPQGAPLAVVLPASTAEVAATVRIAARYGLAVVARGAGSGLAGGTTPSNGALVIGLNRMEWIAVDADQMLAHVAAGAITIDIQRAAERVGLFYPPDPSSQTASTIGGNLACNAGGPRCLKYGVTADYVLAVTAVLADGSIVRWGDGLAGQGPDNALAQLLVGSEGTLALITEATLRLVPQPPARRTTMAVFERLEDACATVETIMAAGLVPASLELMDATTIAAVEAYLQIGLPRDAGALLLMLADGEPESVAADAARLADLAQRGGAQRVTVAQNAADEANLWKARRAVAPSLARIRPNRLGEDISVPLPRIAECVREIQAVSQKFGLPIVVFGHAGDGNLHPNILFDARDAAETAQLWPCAEAIFRVALNVGGTLSGEHGIGTLKRGFMHDALGAVAIEAQQRIKQRFDPGHLLNPGKVLPA